MSSTRADRYRTLLDPVLVALDSATAAVKVRGREVQAESEFLQFKLYATLELGDRIRKQIPARPAILSSVGEVPLEVTVNRSARFMLYILVDAFLFESASVRDALLQFVNVAFSLGISKGDRRFPAKVKERLHVTHTSNTGMEEWIEPSRCPTWLTELLELRNVTTHRHPLRLPEQYQWRDDGIAAPAWRGHVGIETSADSYELLENFIDHTEQEVSSLLRASLERLGALVAE